MFLRFFFISSILDLNGRTHNCLYMRINLENRRRRARFSRPTKSRKVLKDLEFHILFFNHLKIYYNIIKSSLLKSAFNHTSISNYTFIVTVNKIIMKLEIIVHSEY